MNLEELVRQHGNLLAAVGGLRGPSLLETGLRVFCVRAVLARYEPGETFSETDLLTLGEDLELPVTPERLVTAALATGVVAREKSGMLRVQRDIFLGDVYPDLRGRKGAGVPLADYERLVAGAEQRGMGDSAIASPESCIHAIGKAHEWTNGTLVYVMSEGLEGVPCFWQCESDVHRPLFGVPGTSTTMVHLWTWLRSRGFGVRTESCGEVKVAALCQAVLKLQRAGEEWSRGAFSVWGPDDDFSGSFEEGPEVPAGPCPTLDGTAGAIEVLAMVMFAPELRANLPTSMMDLVADSIRSGVDFVLRTQLDGGGWGIYRYESDASEVVPREVSSCLALQALAAGVRTGRMEDSVLSRIEIALESYGSWIECQAKGDGDLRWWLPDFTARISSEAERQISTVWVIRSLLAMKSIGLKPRLQPVIESLLVPAVRFITREWTVAADVSAPVRFRVPRWRGGLSPDTIAWNLPRDPLVASTVLQYLEAMGDHCPDEWWVSINQSVGNAVRTQEHGHWAHYLQRREGRNYASPGFTKYCVELLLQFLRYVSLRTKRFATETREW